MQIAFSVSNNVGISVLFRRSNKRMLIKYIVIKSNSLPSISETDEEYFEAEIRNILGHDYETIYSEEVENGTIVYIGSKEKEPNQPNRAIHSWNDYNMIHGYIPNKIVIIYKKQNKSLTDNELKTICNVFGDKSISYAKELFT